MKDEVRDRQRDFLEVVLSKDEPQKWTRRKTPEYETRLDYQISMSPQSVSKYIPLKRTDEHFNEYLTGFWEGDGSISIKGIEGYRISLAQKYPSILISIQEALEGGLLSTHKNSFSLEFRGNQAVTFIEKVLLKHVVGTLRSAQINRELLFSAARPHLPTPSWFVGFWDAEGSVAVQDHITISVSNKDRKLLESIRDLWNCGGVYSRQDGVSSWHLNSCPKNRSIYDKVYSLLTTKSLNPEKKRNLEIRIQAPAHRGKEFVDGDPKVIPYHNREVQLSSPYLL